ncbi:MAG: acyl dehydratase [Gammaproteobacteria bacterium]|jgi:acyl dehydratase
MPTHEYQVVAYNYAHDSENKIHDDKTAAQYGFKGGLVPGVADYGYLSRAAFQAWGEPWLRGGSMNAKFIKPIYHGEVATAVASADDSDSANQLTLSLLNPEGVCCAVGSATLKADAAPPEIEEYPRLAPLAVTERPIPGIESFAAGRILGSVEYIHDAQAAREMSESLFVEALQTDTGETIWHPALCLSYANRITKENVQLGAWVHTASQVNYFGQPIQGEAVSLRGRVANTYDKRGHVVTELDLAMFANEQRALVQIRHTAIIRLATAHST